MIKRILFILLLLFTGCNEKETKLRVYIWSDYINPIVIKKFEKEYTCKVIFDVFETNESMYAKLKAGASGYDIIVPSNYFIDILVSQNMLQTIDHQKIPNLKNIDTNYLPVIKEIPLDYCIPYMIGMAGIGYRKDLVPDIDHSWNVFSSQKMKKRMTMLNDIRETMGAALLYLGYSVNSTNANEIDAAVAQLLSWKKNLAKFESEQYKNGLASAEFLIIHGYTADVVQVMLEDDQVDCFLPKEGATLNMDNFAIPASARQVDLAHAFINFMLLPENAALNMNVSSHLSPVTAAYPLVDEDLRNIKAFLPTKEMLDKAQLITDVGPHINLYLEAWRKIKDE